MENILSRRSIRKFTDQEVSDEQISALLKAAMSAPSAANMQPWDFVVIKDRKILDEIPKFHKYTQMLLEANLAIVVCGNKLRATESKFWAQDCTAATQNILLAANSLGLGSVWCGLYPVEEFYQKIQELLEIPSEVFPVSLVAIGYPAEMKPPSDRFDEKKIHYNKW